MIKHAAIRQDKIVYVGPSHSACMLVMQACGIERATGVQGFVTDEGKFVDRETAYRIAVANNQIVHKHGAHGEPVLYSEDLKKPATAEPYAGGGYR